MPGYSHPEFIWPSHLDKMRLSFLLLSVEQSHRLFDIRNRCIGVFNFIVIIPRRPRGQYPPWYGGGDYFEKSQLTLDM